MIFFGSVRDHQRWKPKATHHEFAPRAHYAFYNTHAYTHNPILSTEMCIIYSCTNTCFHLNFLHHIYNLHTCIRLCTANLLRYILCNMISCIHANPPQIIVTNSGHCICDPSPMSKRFPETRTSRGSREISRGQISQ